MLRVCAKAAVLALRRPGRAWLMIRMAWWVIALSALVKMFPLPRALQLIAPREPTGRPRHPLTQRDLSTAIDAVLGANVLALKPNCWKRSAILHRYLSLNGTKTRVVFGVKRETAGELKGHAWLESNGEPILESSPPDYLATYTFPSSQPFEIDLAKIARRG
jgi:hypothetical protein